MNRLIDKYGYKGAQDVMQFISFVLGITIIALLVMQNSLLKKNNSLLSELNESEVVVGITSNN